MDTLLLGNIFLLSFSCDLSILYSPEPGLLLCLPYSCRPGVTSSPGTVDDTAMNYLCVFIISIEFATGANLECF